DLFGRKRVFRTGIAGFGIASLAAGLAQNPAERIAARVVQGAAAAAMIPQLLATFRTIFTHAERGKAFGMYGAILGFASALGLVLGGVLTDANLFGWSWRSVFFVNVPVAVLAFVAAARLVPETRDRSAGRPDLTGAALLAAALLASAAVPLAQRYGRYVLCGGGLLLAAGTAAIQLGAGHVGTGTDPWPVVPGLVLAGAGLSLLVIPLANVVLAAVPSQAAGGAG